MILDYIDLKISFQGVGRRGDINGKQTSEG
jgi:hypothetical protein